MRRRAGRDAAGPLAAAAALLVATVMAPRGGAVAAGMPPQAGAPAAADARVPVYLTGPEFPGTLPSGGRGYQIGKGPVVVDVALSTRHVARVSGRVSDQNFYQYLRLGLRPLPFARAQRGDRGGVTISGRLFFRFADDVDGGPRAFRAPPGPDPFRDILDAELGRRDLAPRLYTGYVQLDGLPASGRVRIGRQYFAHTASYQIDGAHISARPRPDVSVYGYAGVPVTYFFGRGGSSLAGVGASARPWRLTRVQFEYTRAETDRGEDDLLTLGAERSFRGGVRTEAFLRELDGRPWDVRLRLGVPVPYAGILARLRYRQVLSDVGRHTYPVAPLTALLGPEKRLRNVLLELSRPLAASVEVAAGAQAQVVASRQRLANLDYRRFFVSLDFAGLPWPGAFVTPRLERWETDADESTELGLRWTQVFSRRLEAWVGSDFARFLFDFLRRRERENVRLYYAGVLWRARPEVEMGFDFEAEQNATPTAEDPFFTLTAWVNYAFR